MFFWVDDSIYFHSGFVLHVFDRISYDRDDEPIDHSFSYSFCQDGRRIFLLDTHERCRAIAWDGPCHVEVPGANQQIVRIEYKEGLDWLKGVHFLRALRFACLEMEGKGNEHPWRAII